MKYVGIDLHKKTISGCVVVKERGKQEGGGPQAAGMPGRSGNQELVQRAGQIRGRRGSHSQLRMVREAGGAAGPARGPGASEEAADHRREQAQERQARRPGAGRVPGQRRDSAGLSSLPAGSRASDAGPLARTTFSAALPV